MSSVGGRLGVESEDSESGVEGQSSGSGTESEGSESCQREVESVRDTGRVPAFCLLRVTRGSLVDSDFLLTPDSPLTEWTRTPNPLGGGSKGNRATLDSNPRSTLSRDGK